jgi:predicted dehydrogenase
VAETPSYAILGRGRWARAIRGVLAGENRRTKQIEETRQRSTENDAAYRSRISGALAASGARVAWLCVPPGPHMAAMIEAALSANLHVVVEKPWLCSPSVTNALLDLARKRQRVVAIHYQYCFLKEVQDWRREFNRGRGYRFGGCFTVSRRDHLGINAMDELGSHLLAMRDHAVPQSSVSEIVCGYEMREERRIWVEKPDKQSASIDFLTAKEPIIQRFIAGVEAALDGAELQFGLDFALRVAGEIEALKIRAPL